jgi:hypothetical protein
MLNVKDFAHAEESGNRRRDDVVDEIERLPDLSPSSSKDAAALQRKVKEGLAAELRLENGSVAPWERSRLRKFAAEGRKAQEMLRRRGHEPSLPDDVPPPD